MSRLKEIIYNAKKYNNKDFVFIYQMGKVGSDTLCKSIGHEYCEHLHTLYGNNPNDKFLCAEAKLKRKIIFLCKRLIIRYKFKSKKIRIITLARNLESRDPSMFFQDIDGYINKERSSSFDSYVKFNSGGIDAIIDLYFKRYDFLYGENWFDKEIKRFSGIDILNNNFEDDYLLVENKKFKILVLKTNAINKSETIISNFLERQIRIKESNTAESKWYSLVYKEFINKLKACKKERISKYYQNSKVNKWLK